MMAFFAVLLFFFFQNITI